MTSTINGPGRLGNQIIRNLAVSILAEKHNLKVDYKNKQLINELGIELFSGSNSYNSTQKLTDNNYSETYDSDKLNYNLDPTHNYFQTRVITNIIYNYLHKDSVKSNIIKNNKFKERYSNNNDLFIHIRLGDAAKWNPGIKYYINAIKNISFENLYISTDDKNNNMIIELLQLYPSSKLIEFDEITTFQFASTCKHIILSHGSFSATIGYLSYFSNVYYPEYEWKKKWYGDMFSIDKWVRLSVV